MLEDKTVIITGGAGFLGHAVVDTLGSSGANIVVADREDALKRATFAPGVVPVAVDLLQPPGMEAAVAAARDRFGRVTGLVCLAGGFFGDTPVLDTPAERMREQFELNLMTAFTAVTGVIPAMFEAGDGSIVCVSSRPAVSTVAGSVAYASSKLGVLKLVDLVAEEYREEGVRANAVIPSIIDTPANRRSMPGADHTKWVRPEQIAAVIEFLVSDRSEVVSGAHIPVYGLA